MDYPAALRRQAADDFAVYELLEQTGASICHLLHYLQMSSEKLARAARVRSDQSGAEDWKHVGLTKLWGVLRDNNSGALAFSMNKKAFREYLRSLRPSFEAVERLAPAVAKGGPNPEYPWRTSKGETWTAPCDHDFRSVQSLLRDGAFVKFLRSVLLRFDQVFEPAPDSDRSS